MLVSKVEQEGRPPMPDTPRWTDAEIEELRRARQLLEGQSLAMRLGELLGKPVEHGLALLPRDVQQRVQRATRAALERALRAAVSTLGQGAAPRRSSDRLHKLGAAASGAVGGLFGLGGLVVELPLTTVLMLRSIADVARSEGHDLRAPETQLACLEVFALGGSRTDDDAVESGYYAVRAALAQALAEAARHVAERGLAAEGAPALVRALAGIAARFGIVVEQKLAAGALPVVGAALGSAVNTLFLDHFQKRARGHFVVKRLETRFGAEEVRRVYLALADTPPASEPQPARA
jgi:hypothetical protein